jgi:hypothetical protein
MTVTTEDRCGFVTGIRVLNHANRPAMVRICRNDICLIDMSSGRGGRVYWVAPTDLHALAVPFPTLRLSAVVPDYVEVKYYWDWEPMDVDYGRQI